LTFDITIMDEEGNGLVEIAGFTLRRIGNKAAFAARDEMKPVEKKYYLSAEMEKKFDQLLEDKSGSGGITDTEGVIEFIQIVSNRQIPQFVVTKQRFGASNIVSAKATLPQATIKQNGSPAPSSKRAFAPRPRLANRFVAPVSELEKQIAGIWQEL